MVQEEAIKEDTPKKAPAKQQTAFVPKYSVGETVEGNWGGCGDWYRATVQSVDLQRRCYSVFYEDDQVAEHKVPEKNIRTGSNAVRQVRPRYGCMPGSCDGLDVADGASCTIQ